MFLTDVFDEKHVFARIMRRAENAKGVFVYVLNDFATALNAVFADTEKFIQVSEAGKMPRW